MCGMGGDEQACTGPELAISPRSSKMPAGGWCSEKGLTRPSCTYRQTASETPKVPGYLHTQYGSHFGVGVHFGVEKALG